MFNSSEISVMVNLWLTVIHPLILLMFSSVFAVDGLPLRLSSSTDSRPLLERSCQRKTFYLVRVSLPKHFSNISKVCAPLNPFLAQNLMQTHCCKVDDIFFCEKSKPHTKTDVHNTASLWQMWSYQAENLTERQWYFYQHNKKRRMEIGRTRAPHGDESYNLLIKVVFRVKKILFGVQKCWLNSPKFYLIFQRLILKLILCLFLVL